VTGGSAFDKAATISVGCAFRADRVLSPIWRAIGGWLQDGTIHPVKAADWLSRCVAAHAGQPGIGGEVCAASDLQRVDWGLLAREAGYNAEADQ